MSELVFPALGSLFVLYCVLPLCALAAKVLLLAVESNALGGPLRHVNLRYALLTGSSLLPIAWFVSAGVHQAESGDMGLACLWAHDDPASCLESASFASLLVGAVGWVWYRTRRVAGLVGASASPGGTALHARIDRLVASHHELADLARLVWVTECADVAIATRGLFRRGVYLTAAFAQTLTDDELHSALGHERQHLRSFDPLRYWLLELVLRLNPCGRLLLAEHATHWQIAREAQCDRQAVLAGANPLALADAIVRAARPSPRHCAVSPAPRHCAALSLDDTAVVRLRVGLLVALSEAMPALRSVCAPSLVPVPLALFALALLLPHQTSTQALDAVHSGTEQVIALLLAH